MYKAQEFDGLLWGAERRGPLYTATASGAPTCFCAHRAGVDWSRVRQGYAALWRHCQNSTAAEPGSGVPMQILMRHPEILGWQLQWTRSYGGLYDYAKRLAPERRFGLGLWHYWFINPLLRAEWDIAEFAASADYIRLIPYHVPEGPRILHYLGMLGRTAALRIVRDDVWGQLKVMLGPELPTIEIIERTGLPASSVGQDVELVRRLSGGRAQVIAGIGIGIGVFQDGLKGPMAPTEVAAAMYAAHAAGADGITVSPNYAEMRHETIAAVGETLRSLAGEAP